MKTSRRGFVGLGSAALLTSVTSVTGCSGSKRGEPRTGKTTWKYVYGLDTSRHPIQGSERELAASIRRGADLRINTEFRHNEHIDTCSDNPEIIQEVADFPVTYLLEDRWVAGIMTLRQPISIPDGFGPRPSMSFFMYNQNGQQAIARPYLDGIGSTGETGPSPLNDHSAMPKYHEQDNWDAGTNAPSSNFVYDFEVYRFRVHDAWQQMLAHTADGTVVSGSVDALAGEVAKGSDVKVGIRGLCVDLTDPPTPVIDHEVFVNIGSSYYYTERKLFIAGTDPLVRVNPAIPLRYSSKSWDFGWLMPRTDGFVARWLADPYTLKFQKSEGHYAIRWFVR